MSKACADVWGADVGAAGRQYESLKDTFICKRSWRYAHAYFWELLQFLQQLHTDTTVRARVSQDDCCLLQQSQN
nr:MAG TPA_asm: hypothetical protein [Bacteriophage sp.]